MIISLFISGTTCITAQDRELAKKLLKNINESINDSKKRQQQAQEELKDCADEDDMRGRERASRAIEWHQNRLAELNSIHSVCSSWYTWYLPNKVQDSKKEACIRAYAKFFYSNDYVLQKINSPRGLDLKEATIFTLLAKDELEKMNKEKIYDQEQYEKRTKERDERIEAIEKTLEAIDLKNI